MTLPARWRRVAIVLMVVSAGGSVAWARSARDERRFPHRAHERLFPTCTGCHAGIPSGDRATTFPAPSTCTGCHNGTDAKVVAWTGPARTPSNLTFDHPAHADLTRRGGDSLDCLGCHGVGPDRATRPWMVVQRAPPAECISCHAHAAPIHLAAQARCESCHVPVVRAVLLSDSAVSAFPKPTSHDAAAWISEHKASATTELQRCAVCHSRESCARCHVNATTLPAITSLGSDRRVARMVRGRPATYPTPTSHARVDFAGRHGALAKANIASCANCHAQPSCQTCHIGTLASAVIAKLPRPGPGNGPGVQLRGPSPTLLPAAFAHTLAPDTTPPPVTVRVHTDGFARTHGPIASSGRLDCAGCHQQRFCTSCHQGSGARRYHAFNFVSRHASTAYGRETSCASCHNTETFCKACHVQSGLAGAATRRTAGAAHGTESLWVLQHGQAARQGLESCAGCHQQTDCLRCHSTVTQRVNPHGPDFDATRMRGRSKIVCGYCHIGEPK